MTNTAALSAKPSTPYLTGGANRNKDEPTTPQAVVPPVVLFGLMIQIVPYPSDGPRVDPHGVPNQYSINTPICVSASPKILHAAAQPHLIEVAFFL